MTKINQKGIDPNYAGFIAAALDAKDGQENGMISASVWNDFVKDKGGKTIKNQISVENAKKSISVYLSKNSKIKGVSQEELMHKWFTQTDTKYEKGHLDPNFIEHAQEARDKNPKEIHKKASYITDWLNGKYNQENIPTMSKYNCPQVMLEVFKNFKGKKFPATLGTNLFGMQVFDTLVQRAKELGISTYYNKNTKFGGNMVDAFNARMAAIRDLTYLIAEKEKGIPQWKPLDVKS